MEESSRYVANEVALASYPVSEIRAAIMRSVDEIDDSAVMRQIFIAVNNIVGAARGIRPSGYHRWHQYKVSDETMQMTVKNRRFIPNRYDELLKEGLKEKYE